MSPDGLDLVELLEIEQLEMNLFRGLGEAGEVEHWSVRESTATVGGGSLPGDARPSFALVYGGPNASRKAKTLRLAKPALVGRLHEGELWLDFRSLRDGEDEFVLAALKSRG